MTSIESILKQRGPSLSSELVEELKAHGLSEVNARQRISRAQDAVVRLAGLRLANGVRFLYLPDQFGTGDYWEAIERAFHRSGKAYWSAVVGLKARGGVCPLSQFPVVCGAPASRKGQLSPSRILERLNAIQLLETVAVEGASEPFVRFVPHRYDPRGAHEARAVLMAESVVLHGLRDWARSLGLGSFGKFRVRGGDEMPIVSSIAWDLSAPSYVRPLVSVRDGRAIPGFIVADVILGGAVDADVVEVFVRKHDMASSFAQAPSVMPFLVGEVFTQEGFALAKQKGIVPVTTTNLFGVEIAKALKALIQLLADTGERAAVNPEYLEQVLNSLTRIEGAANNLRGALFEHVIGALVKDVEGGFLEIGGIWRDRDSGDTAEIDVLLNRDSEPPLVVECKAKTPGAMVSQKEVEHWLTDRVPKLKTMLGQSRHFADAKPQFEIWSNGPFHPAALQWLGEQPRTVEGYSWNWRDGEALKKVAEKAKSPSIRKTLNEHYFKHPLATLATTRTSKRAKSAKAA